MHMGSAMASQTQTQTQTQASKRFVNARQLLFGSDLSNGRYTRAVRFILIRY